MEYRKLSDLKELVGNPRKISKKDLDRLIESIKNNPEYFEARPLILSNRTGELVVIAGNQRLKAAKRLKLQTVPTYLMENLTEQKEREIIIRDNISNGEFDYEILKCDWNVSDLELWGLEIPDIKDTPENDSDKIPDEIEGFEGACSEGDLWKLGDHRLLCGDSTNPKNIEIVLSGNDWDTLIFDPPYEIEDLYKSALLPFQQGKRLLIFWDFKRFAIAGKWSIDYGWTPQYEFIWDCITSWYTPNRPLARHKACGYFAEDPAFNFDKAIIHDGKKRKAGIVHNTRGDCDYKPLDGAVHIRTVESFPNASEGDIHKHGKPVEWITAIFNGIGGESYLDLFGGGGTTLCVCEALKRKSFTIELNPKSCNAIISRWEKMTNKKAELLNSNV
jgi:hypothetical protein